MFVPGQTAWSVSTFFSLRQAFLDLGVAVEGGCVLPKSVAMQEFVNQFRPDAVLELGRVRSELKKCKIRVPHVAWLSTPVHRTVRQLGSSSIVYFECMTDAREFAARRSRRFSRHLPLGFDGTLRRDPRMQPRCDVALFADIPAPWMATELKTHLGQARSGRAVTLDAFLRLARTRLREGGFPTGEFPTVAGGWLRELAGAPASRRASLRGAAAMTRLQTYGRTVRAAELASRLWPALAIRGGPEWEEHAAFGDRYSLLEAGLADHARAFLETRVCLFAPTSAIHWVFECMAVGAPPAVLRDPRLGLRELLDEEFDAGVHYLSVRGMEDRPTVERYVRDARARARMGHEASRLVRARHTWRHRAATILHDLSEHLDGPRE